MSKNKELNKMIKEEVKEPKMRQIIVETDGNMVRIVKTEVAGTLELKAILNSLLIYCDNLPKNS